MKLFFYAAAVLLSAAVLAAALLSGCGTAAENNRPGSPMQMAESDKTGRAEAAVPEPVMPQPVAPDAAAPGAAKPGPALPDAPRQGTALPDIVKPGPTLPDATKPGTASSDMPAPDSQSKAFTNAAINWPVRTVAESVSLGKENIGRMTEKELLDKLLKIAAKTDVAAKDAAYDKKTWMVHSEKTGKRLDTAKIIKAAMKAAEGDMILYSWTSVTPEVTAVQLKRNIRMIAKYTTPFLDRSRPRIRNIRRVSAKLDRMIIMPGQEFSFNKATGSKSKKAGYEDATIIVRTPKGPEHKLAPGGGVCQVSTTLYNAILKCGLQVTERHEHSDDVYYVPDGKDATVMYGGADFRFVNSGSFPIMIRIYAGQRSLQVRIYENSADTGHQAIIS